MNRDAFPSTHPGVLLLEVDRPAEIGAYLVSRGVLSARDLPVVVEKAGEGNMNCTLRVVTPHRRIIIKQGRPWVEKYDHIEAPWGRTIVEGRFYEAARACPGVASRMPTLLDLDERMHVLTIEDVEDASDFTHLYAGGRMTGEDAGALGDYLTQLHRMPVPASLRPMFANRDMRTLNHEHIFDLPLRDANGLDLDRLTSGLAALAEDLRRRPAYVERVGALGRMYLADGVALVHGDYFPGSWLKGANGIKVIDPEFCFLGCPEFDCGVAAGHLLLADQPLAVVRMFLEACDGSASGDRRLVFQFAGVEIMRRVIGVAQLPLSRSLEQKRDLLSLSRRLVAGQGPEGL